MIHKIIRTNKEILDRDYDGKFVVEHKIQDDIEKMHRPIN